MHSCRRDAFFQLVFEANPLDNHADSALHVRMRGLDLIYNKETIEAMYDFFKAPAPTLDSINALIVTRWRSSVPTAELSAWFGCCSKRLSTEWRIFRKRDTKISLQFAMEVHKTLDLDINIATTSCSSSPKPISPSPLTNIQRARG